MWKLSGADEGRPLLASGTGDNYSRPPRWEMLSRGVSSSRWLGLLGLVVLIITKANIYSNGFVVVVICCQASSDLWQPVWFSMYERYWRSGLPIAPPPVSFWSQVGIWTWVSRFLVQFSIQCTILYLIWWLACISYIALTWSACSQKMFSVLPSVTYIHKKVRIIKLDQNQYPIRSSILLPTTRHAFEISTRKAWRK